MRSVELSIINNNIVIYSQPRYASRGDAETTEKLRGLY